MTLYGRSSLTSVITPPCPLGEEGGAAAARRGRALWPLGSSPGSEAGSAPAAPSWPPAPVSPEPVEVRSSVGAAGAGQSTVGGSIPPALTSHRLLLRHPRHQLARSFLRRVRHAAGAAVAGCTAGEASRGWVCLLATGPGTPR